MKAHMTKKYIEIDIDRGYSSCKILAVQDVENAPLKKLKFSSLAIRAQQEDKQGRHNIVTVNDKYFFVGDDALQHSLPSTVQLLNDDASASEEFRASILHCIDLLQASEVNVLKISIADALFST
jgi:Actin like proteins N terminal domain